MVTPAHIVPEWYFLPFYAILRSIPNKLGGVIAMISSIFVQLMSIYLMKQANGNVFSQILNVKIVLISFSIAKNHTFTITP